MSGDRLRDAWTTLEVDPEGAAVQVLRAQQDQAILDGLQTALRSLVAWFDPDLSSPPGHGSDEGDLDPVRALQDALAAPHPAHEAPRPMMATLVTARAMVRHDPHAAVGWIADGGSAAHDQDQWARAVLAMLGHYRVNLCREQGERDALDAALEPTIRSRAWLAATARPGTVAALDDAPEVLVWALGEDPEPTTA